MLLMVHPLYLGHVLEPLLQRVQIELLAFLATRLHSQSLRRLRFPDAQIGVVTPRDDELCVSGVRHREDALHALGVVGLATAPLAGAEDPYHAVVAATDELAPRGREGYVHYGRDVILKGREGRRKRRWAINE